MLSFGLSRQSVCHHCRYRRVLQDFARARQKRPRSFTSTRRYQSDAPYQAAKFDDEAEEFNEWEQYDHRAQNTAASIRGGRSDTRIKHLPLNLNKLALEVNTLGRPASILRFDIDGHKKPSLRWKPESNDQISKQVKEEELEQVQVEQSADIVQALQDGQNKPSEDETTAAIEELKDQWLGAMNQQSIPTAADCWEMYERLSQCFSKPQLEQYLKDSARDEAEDFDDLEGVFLSGVCSRSPWYSGFGGKNKQPGWLLSGAATGEGCAPHPWLLFDYAKTSKKKIGNSQWTWQRKMWFVEHILRRSWHLRTDEELQTPGALDITLVPMHCRLLQRFDLFRQIEQQLGVKVTISPTHDAIRLAGHHEKCARAFIAIYAPLQTVANKHLYLGLGPAGSRTWKSLDISTLLKTIADFAKVQIEKYDSGESLTFSVYYLAPPKADRSGLDESAYENISSIMLSILADSTSEQALVSLPAKTKSLHYVPLQLSSILPIHLRNTRWVRGNTTVRSDSETTTRVPVDTQELVKSLLNVSVQALTPLREHAQGKTPDVALNMHWQREPIRRTTFETGYVVFQVRKQSAKHKGAERNVSKQSSKPNEVRANSRLFADLKKAFRTFAPNVPGGVNALEAIADDNLTSDQLIVVRLKPDNILARTESHPSKFDTLPDLEIHLMPDRSAQGCRAIGACFVLEHNPQQLMLSREVSDAVVRSRTVVAAAENLDPQLQAWLQPVVATDGHVDMRTVPRSIDIEVPIQATMGRPALCSHLAPIKQHVMDEQKTQDKSTLSSVPDDMRLPRATSSDLFTSGNTDASDATLSLSKRSEEDGDVEDSNRGGRSTALKTATARHNYSLDIQLAEDSLEDQLESYIPSADSDAQGGNSQSDQLRRLDFDLPPPKAPTGPNQLFTPDLRWRGNSQLPINVKATYRFVGLEYHDRLRTRHRGCDLVYNIVDAGEMRGRHEKLVLEFPSEDASRMHEQSQSPAEQKESVLRKQIRDKIIRRDPSLRALEKDEEVHRCADWLDKGVQMIRRLA